MNIKQERVYDIDREQWTGYDRAYMELPSGERAVFFTMKSGFETPQGQAIRSWHADEEAAWATFGALFRDWLKDRPGILLWRLEPHVVSEEEDVLDVFDSPTPTIKRRKRYAVVARVAVTENRDFTDPAKMKLEFA